MLEGLRLPLSVVEARCECGMLLDSLGRHRAACSRSGRLRRKAVAPEKTLARMCREAGATERCNAKLREMNVEVAATDEREIEVQASASLSWCAARCRHHTEERPHRCGNACDQADRVNGIVASRARRDKENKYAELLQGDRCRLVVVGMETGGRQALQFVEMLAAARAREAPRVLRRSAFLAWTLSVLWQSFRQLALFALGRSARHRLTIARFGGLVPGLRSKCAVFDLTKFTDVCAPSFLSQKKKTRQMMCGEAGGHCQIARDKWPADAHGAH